MPQFRLLGDVMFLVPFDGSELAEAALVRATQFGVVLEERVLAVSVIPKGNADYARERGWIGPGEPFDATAVVSGLHERVTELCPSADFRHEVVDRYAPAGTISQRLRRVARGEGASMVFSAARTPVASSPPSAAPAGPSRPTATTTWSSSGNERRRGSRGSRTSAA